MRPLKDRLQKVVIETGSPLSIIEKDYLLSYMLLGIASVDKLKASLIFKGGTALKKCYFGDYRFSEDLDFSTLEAPQGNELESHLRLALQCAEKYLSEQGPFELSFSRRPEKAPHPAGQEAFHLNAKFPWHPSPLCRIKIEVTHVNPSCFHRLKERSCTPMKSHWTLLCSVIAWKKLSRKKCEAFFRPIKS